MKAVASNLLQAQVTVTSTAQTLEALLGFALYSGIMAVTIQAETGQIRYRGDGVDPTASSGFLIDTLGEGTYAASDLSRLKLIRVGSSNVTVNLIFWG
jgi:hypothetical protein